MRSPSATMAPTATTMRGAACGASGVSCWEDTNIGPRRLLLPVGGSRMDRRDPGHLVRRGIPVLHRVSPADVMWRHEVGVKRRLIAVDLVKIERVWIFVVLEDVEAEAAGFVVHRS